MVRIITDRSVLIEYMKQKRRSKMLKAMDVWSAEIKARQHQEMMRRLQRMSRK